MLDKNYAEKFSKKKAEERRKKFLHPENWEIIEIKGGLNNGDSAKEKRRRKEKI